MTQKSYYDILGISKGASADEIKKAYRRLAMKFHPDRNQNNKEAESKFKEVQEAYAVLSDDKKRSLYDQLGHENFENAAKNGGAGAHGFSGGFGGFENVGDIFGDIFGNIFNEARSGERKSNRATRGHDLLVGVKITLEESVFGVTKIINIQRLANCHECGGSGARKGSKPEKCKHCHGSGQIHLQQGFFSIQQTCPSCRGAGEVIADPCTNCHGRGQNRIAKKLSIKIPAGIDNGDRVRLGGEGNAGTHGAATGDLYVEVTVMPHKIFRRNGLDLHCDLPITFTSATLGDEYEIPTLDGKVKLKIPAETQSGKVLRLSGKGIKGLRGGLGDLFCTIKIETPINLDNEQKELLRKFDELLAKDRKKHSPLSRNWFNTVRDFFTKFS